MWQGEKNVPLSETISKREKTSMTSMIAEFSAVHIHRKQTRKLGFIQWAGTEDTMTDSSLKRGPTALAHYC